MKIDSKIETVGTINVDFTENEIKNEPMLFNSDLSGAWDNGSFITRRNKRTNEVRNQVQIYMSAENAGW